MNPFEPKLTFKGKEITVEALAEAMASLNKEDECFRKGKKDYVYDETHGHYQGYLTNMEEILRRSIKIQKRLNEEVKTT